MNRCWKYSCVLLVGVTKVSSTKHPLGLTCIFIQTLGCRHTWLWIAPLACWNTQRARAHRRIRDLLTVWWESPRSTNTWLAHCQKWTAVVQMNRRFWFYNCFYDTTSGSRKLVITKFTLMDSNSCQVKSKLLSAWPWHFGVMLELIDRILASASLISYFKQLRVSFLKHRSLQTYIGWKWHWMRM